MCDCLNPVRNVFQYSSATDTLVVNKPSISMPFLIALRSVTGERATMMLSFSARNHA